MSKKKLIEKFDILSNQLLNIDLSDENDIIIDQVNRLLAEREIVIEEINQLDTEEVIDDSEWLKLLQKNNQIETMFEEIMLKIKGQINGIAAEKVLHSKKKKAHKGYLNHMPQNDGVFIDKKK